MARARERGIRILGDLPIYVGLHSADVWAHQDLFDLDEGGWPRAVSGVPPDYFSETGQLWGNPLYRWDRLATSGYRWWVQRLAANLRLADEVRLDHFRGFIAYWRVEAGSPTAAGGSWEVGPGRALFSAFETAPSIESWPLPLVAEDLGVPAPEVEALRRDLEIPGMAVLQFGFSEDHSTHAPENLQTDTVVYTGTHDNPTSRAWFEDLDEASRSRVLKACSGPPETMPWPLVRAAYESQAGLAVIPVQDVLSLGEEGRMNVPGVGEGNWGWRMEAAALTPALCQRLRGLVEASGRC